MTRVVGVHGIGNYRPGESAREAAVRLAAIWDTALDRGHTAAGHDGPARRAPRDMRVAYYADLLHAAGRQSGPADLESLDGFERELLDAWLAELPLPGNTAAGRATWAPRQAVSWLARTRFPGRTVTEWFVATFVREVATYLRADAGVRDAVRDHVARVIDEHRADVVIAHSLGSVVAYEALWRHQHLTVPSLITLGSPLALPHAVLHRLDPAPVPSGAPGSSGLPQGARPPGVRHWTNLADPGDIVAIPPRGVGRHFDRVDVDEHTVINAFDFHTVRNYLASPLVARALLWETG
ncbi:serine peptidase [Streptomyces sp. NPDC091287]|uniref:serine peptidase n=1 Tax=Streptomyces sp. NPDC091287 TaxID=3365988 RepID=UPI0037F8A9E9